MLPCGVVLRRGLLLPPWAAALVAGPGGARDRGWGTPEGPPSRPAWDAPACSEHPMRGLRALGPSAPPLMTASAVAATALWGRSVRIVLHSARPPGRAG